MHSYRPYLVTNVVFGMLKLGSDLLIVPRLEVDLGKHLGMIQMIKQVFNLGEWILVLDCNFIEGAIINAQADGTVLLCHKQNR